ncbi:unnamed protein product [Arabidopsis lyrata]|uniref:Transmembrane protein n=2 Tax=Arabidopsis TaxID=3701 RepID=A0A8T1XFR8_9BRAS|nr:hypothetical protein ISN44_Un156g000010 [Arabidopsis suecica]KAG7529297.1 hypothetical protein ISN45_Un97g000840 [Arabidopsis thaliana x Arabidopsis arenosa]KAG7530627.1 hypothetical protein ISN45_Un26g000030 [Arabidopsis thaliana x Arabidopsis arenosa]CAH8262261.1 unnamed protein product [Arabidopsis lyrata]
MLALVLLSSPRPTPLTVCLGPLPGTPVSLRTVVCIFLPCFHSCLLFLYGLGLVKSVPSSKKRNRKLALPSWLLRMSPSSIYSLLCFLLSSP